ncbi:MAG: M20/M25/M40 family metallo-hydrolase [Bryobacterales bacterium]|nr:M20/M25/M40 family metallo-hydrolase [Bryobacterales bacterium]
MSGALAGRGSGPVPTITAAALAALPDVRLVLEWFAREKRWINEKHAEVCRIAAPTFQEQKRAEWVAAELRRWGWEAKLDRAGNVVANRPGPRAVVEKGPAVVVTAHLDTVLAPRSEEEIEATRDGRLFGPGVADNGAGLAGLLAIARAVEESPALRGAALPLLLAANVGEEGEGNLSGMRFLCRTSGVGGRAAAFVVLDGPSTDHITTAALASRRFEISISGPGGHSWSDFGTGNPVHTLGRAITDFCDHASRLAGVKGEGPRTSWNFGLIEGGTSINSIPVLAKAKLDLRSESAARIDEMAALMTQSIERALEAENAAVTVERNGSGAARVTAKVREIGSRPGGRLTAGAPLLDHLLAVDRLHNIRAQMDCASTDANIPLSLGIPAVSIGAGGHGGGAHTPAEWFHAEGRETGLRRVMLLLLLLLGDLDARLLAGLR